MGYSELLRLERVLGGAPRRPPPPRPVRGDAAMMAMGYEPRGGGMLWGDTMDVASLTLESLEAVMGAPDRGCVPLSLNCKTLTLKPKPQVLCPLQAG